MVSFKTLNKFLTKLILFEIGVDTYEFKTAAIHKW
jgi:hypothetical protein